MTHKGGDSKLARFRNAASDCPRRRAAQGLANCVLKREAAREPPGGPAAPAAGPWHCGNHLLAHADHDTLVAGAADDGREHRTGRVVAGEAGLQGGE